MNYRWILLAFILIGLVGAVSATNYTTTFYTNGSGSFDGTVQYVAGGANWATIRGGGGNGFTTGSTTELTDLYSFTDPDTFIRLQRGVLVFNTATLPDDAVITNATIQMYYADSAYQMGDTGIGITGFTIDGALSADDFNNNQDTLLSDYLNITTLTAWKTWTLNGSGQSYINKTAPTGFMVRLQPDITNTQPTWSSSKLDMFKFRSMAYPGYAPYLTVSYSTPPSADFFANATTGVGTTAIHFTDTSTGDPTIWHWYENAGAADVEFTTTQNPSAAFGAGTYSIKLNASNAGGFSWMNKTNYIVLSGPGSPLVNWTATPVTGSPSLLVNFIDNSNLGNATGRVCNWSFGDSLSTTPYSATCGNVQHVYSYSGVYSVNYSIVNVNGSSYVYRDGYITVATSQSTSILPTQPKSVQFKIVDIYGNELPGSTVEVSYIASTLPSTDISWLVSAFGVSQTVASQMTNSSLAMTGVTGSDGSLSFIMYPVLKYAFTISNATTGLSKYVEIYPQDNEYIIQCTLPSQVLPTSKLIQTANSTLYITEPNTSYVTFHVIYQDTSALTTNILWNVTCLTNHTVMYSHDFGNPITGIMMDNYTVSTSPRGTEYQAMYDATRA
jgi:PKD repeat protein